MTANECIVYHWWSGSGDNIPARNLRTPIVLSIATLRACNPDIPIYVLDISDNNGDFNDFGDLPARLNFKRFHWEPSLKHHEGLPGWRNLSRLFDLKKFSKAIDQQILVYCDSDIFWKDDPLPLLQNPSKFCFNAYNSGFFYYDKTKVAQFFEVFEAYALAAWHDEGFRYITWQYSDPNPAYRVLDEAILKYMFHKHVHLFNKIDIMEHCTVSGISPGNLNLSIARMVHANGISVQNKLDDVDWKRDYARGLIPLLISEFYQRLTSVLSLKEIYTEEEIDSYLPLQVRLSDVQFIKRLMACKNSEGLFDLMSALHHAETL